MKEFRISNTSYIFLHVRGKICHRLFKLHNDRDIQKMFDYHQKFSDQVLELYIEFGATTSTGGSS